MKEIATISPERLNNGAHYQFMTSVLNYAVADEKIAEETHLKPLVQNLTTALAKEDEDLKISQKSLLTDDIAEADNLRDSLYRAYKKAVKTYLDFSHRCTSTSSQGAESAHQGLRYRSNHADRPGNRFAYQFHQRPQHEVHRTSHNPRIAKFRS